MWKVDEGGYSHIMMGVDSHIMKGGGCPLNHPRRAVRVATVIS